MNRLFLRIFFILCLIFGLINLGIGGVALYGYYKVQRTLSSASLEINQSLSSARILPANVTALASTASSGINLASSNVTDLILGLEKNIFTSKQSFYEESDYFSTLSIPDSNPSQIAQISATFKNIGDQLNATQNEYLPMMLGLVKLEASRANGSVSGINSSLSRLNQSFNLMASSISLELKNTSGIVSIAILGFALYSIMQGIIFIMLAVLILYLAGSLSGKKKQEQDNSNEDDDGAPKRKPKSNDEQNTRSKNEGFIKTLTDMFGIEE